MSLSISSFEHIVDAIYRSIILHTKIHDEKTFCLIKSAECQNVCTLFLTGPRCKGIYDIYDIDKIARKEDNSDITYLVTYKLMAMDL